MKRRIYVFGSFVLVAVSAVCAAFLFSHSGEAPPDVKEATAQETVDYLASEDFVKMDKDNKEEYLEQINKSNTQTPMLTLFLNSNLSEPQRQKLMANILPVISPLINRRIERFEKMPAQEKRILLDAIIDRMELFRQANPDKMFSRERFNLILQYIDPHTRARLRKHIPEMHKRMAERGIPTGDRPF